MKDQNTSFADCLFGRLLGSSDVDGLDSADRLEGFQTVATSVQGTARVARKIDSKLGTERGQADFPHPALGQDLTLSRATPSAASELVPQI
jgi:hypothetical protein